jgi:hypothetical protein
MKTEFLCLYLFHSERAMVQYEHFTHGSSYGGRGCADHVQVF